MWRSVSRIAFIPNVYGPRFDRRVELPGYVFASLSVQLVLVEVISNSLKRVIPLEKKISKDGNERSLF
jgi:hypothetical protein